MLKEIFFFLPFLPVVWNIFLCRCGVKIVLFVLITEIIRVNVVVPLKTFVIEKKT